MTMSDILRARRTFAAEVEGAPAAAPAAEAAPVAPAPAPAAPAGDAPAGPKWWETDTYDAPKRGYLTAKGLTLDDPLATIPKLIDIAANAEKRIGKGLDTIIDRPTKDQPYAEWVAANRAALGLPTDEKGYTVTPPENWPKDMPWDTGLEASAKAIAVKYGIPPAALQELTNLQAASAMAINGEVQAAQSKASTELMADLQKDWGLQTDAKITLAKQAAQMVAEKAGLDMTALGNLSEVLMDKIGDANTLRFMAAIGGMMSDDPAVGLGKPGSMTMTPAEARQQLASMRAPEGEYYKATATNDRAAIARLQPRLDHLTRIAAGG
ncbi:hypothetical protein [Rhodoferax sp.]|uniref:hypothetical protein n=1 Tax=Rhodoferax sp. TaxID=50421 RepID=UPI002ACE6663|nr:hypothetical protein [Rhodoferax sp.]MDZ7919979.1 hypothetical protein [Rhodoferax sp.]